MIKVVNLILVFNKTEEYVLMCKRIKNPYQGLYNFVGGKKETKESDVEAAYRELFEETGISQHDIILKPLFTSYYHDDDLELQIYTGTLKEDITLVEELNPLQWIALTEDFSDTSRYAGNGNIPHMIQEWKAQAS